MFLAQKQIIYNADVSMLQGTFNTDPSKHSRRTEVHFSQMFSLSSLDHQSPSWSYLIIMPMLHGLRIMTQITY